MIEETKDNQPTVNNLGSIPEIGKFVDQNRSALLMVQKKITELGFDRKDSHSQKEAKITSFLDELVEEMSLFAKVTKLGRDQLQWLNDGEEVIVGLAPAKSPHTGMAVTYDQLNSIHPQLLKDKGLSRDDDTEDKLYISYSGDPQVKIFPLHLLTFVVLKRADGSHEVFDSLKVATKLKAGQEDSISSDLSPIFREVSKYNEYSKELLTTLFNLHVAPQIFDILEECWQAGLLKREPTLEELQLNKDELLSFIAYGHDSNNEDNLSRGPRSNPTDHWHNLIPQFRRRIIRLVKNSHPGDSLSLDELEQQNYAQVLERLNALDPITAKLHLKARRSLLEGQQLKMADISGKQVAELLTPEGKIISDVQASLSASFPDKKIEVSVANIKTDPDQVQMKHGAVIKIVAKGVGGHEMVVSLLPLMSEYEAIKSEAFHHYKTYVSTNNSQPLRKFLDENGMGDIVDQVLAWRPTKPMMTEEQQKKYDDKLSARVERRHLSKPNGRWAEIRDLVEASIKGLGVRGSDANFSLPLGLVISVEEIHDQGELTSIVKISYSGNNSATVENILGINVMRA